jgi:hypothetical protein
VRDLRLSLFLSLLLSFVPVSFLIVVICSEQIKLASGRGDDSLERFQSSLSLFLCFCVVRIVVTL